MQKTKSQGTLTSLPESPRVYEETTSYVDERDLLVVGKFKLVNFL